MAERVVLHVGTMKSGTTFLQNVVSANRAPLRAAGVRFVGRKWRDQILAAQDAITHGAPQQPPLDPDGPWSRIVRETEEWPGTALFSVEFFGARRVPKIQQIVDSFGATEVAVVLTVRDLARTIPSMWQESVQNGGTTTWEDYLQAVRTEDRSEDLSDSFWRQQGVAEMARRWAKVVGVDRVVLVTSPPKGAPPHLLWERYAGFLGVDPGSCSLDVPANPSLGLASTMVLRALNERLVDEPLSRTEYHQRVKRVLAKRGMARHRGDEQPLGFDEPWVYERSAAEIATLREIGYPVIGDLDELTSHPVPGVQPADVPLEDQLRAAVRGLEHAVRDLTWAKDGETT